MRRMALAFTPVLAVLALAVAGTPARAAPPPGEAASVGVAPIPSRRALATAALAAAPAAEPGSAATLPERWPTQLAALLPEVAPPQLDADARRRIARHGSALVRAAARHGVDPALLFGLVWVESTFEARARGPAGAQGLLQLMPRTAKGLARALGRPARPWDPEFAAEAGAYHLAALLRRSGGDVGWALIAYNRGVGTAARWQREGAAIPERTLTYVARVLRAAELLRPLALAAS